MPSYQYLIVGGGMTADAAVAGIRQVDAAGTIGLVGAESHTPYNRPPLSKGLWKGKPLESIWRKTAMREAALHLGRRIVALDPSQKHVTDDQGTAYHYDRLLLATGGTPRRIPGDSDAVLYFRSLDDYQQLRLLAQKKQRFAVIGGGFIGSEIAAALAMNGKDVVLVFPDRGIGGRVFPVDLADFLNDYYRQKGVEVRAGETAETVEPRGSKFVVKTRAGHDDHEEELVVDAVVAGLGIRPNIELAEAAGLEIGNGIRVERGACGQVIRTFSPPATWPSSSIPRWENISASSTKTMPTRWERRRAARWPGRPSPTTIFPPSIPTCSSWAMRRWAVSTPA